MWEAYVNDIILIGVAHFLRDARHYQNQKNTLMVGLLPYWDWLHDSWDEYDPLVAWHDWIHKADTFMRWSACLLGVNVILLPVPGWAKIPLFFIGLWAAEWLFAILYHVVNPDKDHSDYRPFWTEIRLLINPRWINA